MIGDKILVEDVLMDKPQVGDFNYSTLLEHLQEMYKHQEAINKRLFKENLDLRNRIEKLEN